MGSAVTESNEKSQSYVVRLMQ